MDVTDANMGDGIINLFTISDAIETIIAAIDILPPKLWKISNLNTRRSRTIPMMIDATISIL